VKEEKGILPITPYKYKKILFYAIESQQGFAYSVRAGVVDQFREMLIKEGFDVDQFYMTKMPTIFISVENPYHLLDVPRVRTFINT